MNAARYEQELRIATDAVLAAGRLLRAEFYRPGGPRGMAGKCPADTEAERQLREDLRKAFPRYGQIGEELPEEDRLPEDDEQHVWSIDPNDGTSAFQKGWRGPAVSLALLRRGVPVLGIVYSYAERAGRGDLLVWSEEQPMRRNGDVVTPSTPCRQLEDHLVLVSQDADRHSEANARFCAPARFRGVPSVAYRLALVAAGEGIAACSLSGPTSWDVAAGHALLRGAGLDLYRRDGSPVTYASSGAAHVGDCWTGHPDVVAALRRRDFRSLLNHPAERPEFFTLATPDPKRIVSNSDLLSRAQGCWLGQLAGDNLGALVEFCSPRDVASLYPGGPRELLDGGYWNLLAGQPTDDSELALMLARSILRSSTYTREGAAQAYAWWYGSHPFDVGTTTSRALGPAHRAWRAGEPCAEAAERAAAGLSSQSNGSLMRISPVGIFGHALPGDVVAELARRDARLTHAHPVCQDAAAVFCVAIAAALRHGLDAQGAYRHARDWAHAHGIHDDVSRALHAAESRTPADFVHQMGWVLIALQNAFYQLLHAPTLVDGLAATVAAGGDTDTNAAIAGALLGAVHGCDAIPRSWLNRLLSCRPLACDPACRHPRPPAFWPVDCLIVAEQLAWLGNQASPSDFTD